MLSNNLFCLFVCCFLLAWLVTSFGCLLLLVCQGKLSWSSQTLTDKMLWPNTSTLVDGGVTMFGVRYLVSIIVSNDGRRRATRRGVDPCWRRCCAVGICASDDDEDIGGDGNDFRQEILLVLPNLPPLFFPTTAVDGFLRGHCEFSRRIVADVVVRQELLECCRWSLGVLSFLLEWGEEVRTGNDESRLYALIVYLFVSLPERIGLLVVFCGRKGRIQKWEGVLLCGASEGQTLDSLSFWEESEGLFRFLNNLYLYDTFHSHHLKTRPEVDKLILCRFYIILQ